MTQENPPEKPPFSERMAIALVAFGRALVRLILLLVIIAALVAIGFYGIPRLYRLFIQPVEQNAARIDDLNAQIDQDRIQMTRQLGTLQGQVFVLGTQAANATATLSGLERAQAEAQTTAQAGFNDQIEMMSTFQAGLNDQVERMSATLASMDGFSGALGDVQSTQDGLIQQMQLNQSAIQTAASVATNESIPVQELQHELSLVKAMELLTRSRLLLAQNNLGLAEQDIRAARELLVSLETEIYPYQLQALQNIIDRLDLALSDIQQAPALVADDLEVAWKLLYAGLPGENGLTPAPGSQLQIETGIPAQTSTPTPSPTSENSETPTPGLPSNATGTPGTGTPSP